MYFLYISGCISVIFFFFFSSRRRHTRFSRDWSSDVCSSDLLRGHAAVDELEMGARLLPRREARAHCLERGIASDRRPAGGRRVGPVAVQLERHDRDGPEELLVGPRVLRADIGQRRRRRGGGEQDERRRERANRAGRGPILAHFAALTRRSSSATGIGPAARSPAASGRCSTTACSSDDFASSPSTRYFPSAWPMTRHTAPWRARKTTTSSPSSNVA